MDPRINEGVGSPRQPLMSQKGPSDMKINMEESYNQTKKFPPKISTQEEIKLVEGKTVTMQGSNQHYQDSFSPFLGTTQRWGQVPFPQKFSVSVRENSLMFFMFMHSITHLCQSLYFPVQSAVNKI